MGFLKFGIKIVKILQKKFVLFSVTFQSLIAQVNIINSNVSDMSAANGLDDNVAETVKRIGDITSQFAPHFA